MMSLMESIFDIGYLSLVIGLGVRILLERKEGAKNFGIMAILLGLGDAFHLIPRLVSHLSLGGFEKNIAALSWGEFVTSITMTIFYIMFYRYYVGIAGDKSKRKSMLIYGLAIVRIGLVLMPQNLWGSQGDYTFAIIRNIPFLIMGILIIGWTYKYRHIDGLKNASIFIFLSFLFYIPVVVGARFIPILGALMIPKTIMYVLIVMVGYRYFVDEFEQENIFKLAISFLIMGLISGVFYREFVKYYKWQGLISLSFIHVHLLTLGFMMLVLVYMLVKILRIDIIKLKRPIKLYLSGLVLTIVCMLVKGIYEITSAGADLFPRAALSGISGLGHMIIGIGMVWVLISLIPEKNLQKTPENKI